MTNQPKPNEPSETNSKPREFFTYTNSRGCFELYDTRLGIEPRHHLVDFTTYEAIRIERDKLEGSVRHLELKLQTMWADSVEIKEKLERERDELKAKVKNIDKYKKKLCKRFLKAISTQKTELEMVKAQLSSQTQAAAGLVKVLESMHIDDCGVDIDELDIETARGWHKSNNERIETGLSNYQSAVAPKVEPKESK